MVSSRSLAAPVDGRLRTLDVLRGIAALLVLMLHFEAFAGVRGIFERGYLAVDFFFMLSGFVLVPMMERSAGANGWVPILLARVARLWPLLALGALLGTVNHALAWGFLPTLRALCLALIGVPNPVDGLTCYPLNEPQWSLVAELAINALHLLILRRLRCGALLVLSGACWLMLATASYQNDGLDLGSLDQDWFFGFVRAGFAYPIGIVLARNRHLLSTFSTPWHVPALLLPALIILPTLAGLPESWGDPLVIVLLVPVLALGAAARSEGTLPHSLRWLGSLSFPLYAVHFTLLEMAYQLSDDLPVSLRAPILLIGLAACFGLAHLLARSPLARGIRWSDRRLRALNAAA